MKMIPITEVEGEYTARVTIITSNRGSILCVPTTSIVLADTLYTKIAGKVERIPVSTIDEFHIKKFNLVKSLIAGSVAFVIIRFFVNFSPGYGGPIW